MAAWRDRRRPCELYHSALEVRHAATRFVIEMTPIRDSEGSARGVVAEGPVGMGCLGRLRLFRYEIRRWPDGAIPDVNEAVASPHRLSDDAEVAERLRDLVPEVPTPVWGRDGLRAGEMWNSNSVVSWLIVSSGLDIEKACPPPGGRAPG